MRPNGLRNKPGGFAPDALKTITKLGSSRPLPSGQINPNEALFLGLALSLLGVVWALSMAPLYGAVIFAGLFFDVVVYTIWLKRRTCWSIIWGGISGGMPILAGRALATGRLDWDCTIFSYLILDTNTYYDLQYALPQ